MASEAQTILRISGIIIAAVFGGAFLGSMCALFIYNWLT